MLFTSRLEAPPNSRTRAQFAPGLGSTRADSSGIERNRAEPSPVLSGFLCTLLFSFESTKQKSHKRHLNINTADLFPLAMYLVHLEIFFLVLCEVALGAQQRRPRSNGARAATAPAQQRRPRSNGARAATAPAQTSSRQETRADSGGLGLVPARFEPGSHPLGSCTTPIKKSKLSLSTSPFKRPGDHGVMLHPVHNFKDPLQEG